MFLALLTLLIPAVYVGFGRNDQATESPCSWTHARHAEMNATGSLLRVNEVGARAKSLARLSTV